MNDLQETMRDLLERIAARLGELRQLQRSPLLLKLHPPATLAEVEEVEAKYDMKLPADYRAFLLIHNGCAEFSGDGALLSTHEMLGGPLHDGLFELKEVQRQVGDEVAAEGFVIEGSFGNTQSFFDRSTQKPDGSMDVVFWDNKESERYPSFTAYLERYVAILEELIGDERAKLR
jgi:hypothetical protein